MQNHSVVMTLLTYFVDAPCGGILNPIHLGKTPMDGGSFACDYITPKMLSSAPCKRNLNLIMFHFKHLCMMATLPAAGAPATQPTPMNTVA